jgi:hypothetical protein
MPFSCESTITRRMKHNYDMMPPETPHRIATMLAELKYDLIVGRYVYIFFLWPVNTREERLILIDNSITSAQNHHSTR